MEAAKKYSTVDEYIASFPASTRKLLTELRNTVKAAAPKNAVEVISYNMPAIKLKSVLVYYAAYKNHIGFYPTGKGMAAFQKALTAYKGSKGAVQFPIDQPLPLKLITRMVKFRVKNDLESIKIKANAVK